MAYALDTYEVEIIFHGISYWRSVHVSSDDKVYGIKKTMPLDSFEFDENKNLQARNESTGKREMEEMCRELISDDGSHIQNFCNYYLSRNIRPLVLNFDEENMVVIVPPKPTVLNVCMPISKLISKLLTDHTKFTFIETLYYYFTESLNNNASKKKNMQAILPTATMNKTGDGKQYPLHLQLQDDTGNSSLVEGTIEHSDSEIVIRIRTDQQWNTQRSHSGSKNNMHPIQNGDVRPRTNHPKELYLNGDVAKQPRYKGVFNNRGLYLQSRESVCSPSAIPSTRLAEIHLSGWDISAASDSVKQNVNSMHVKNPRTDLVEEDVCFLTVFLIDESSSMGSNGGHQDATHVAAKFIRDLGERDFVAAVGFGKECRIIDDWSKRGETLQITIKSIQAEGATPMACGFYISTQLIFIAQGMQTLENVRKRIVLLSDGRPTRAMTDSLSNPAEDCCIDEENTRREMFETVLPCLDRHEITVICVYCGNTEEQEKLYMEDIAKRTNGMCLCGNDEGAIIDYARFFCSKKRLARLMSNVHSADESVQNEALSDRKNPGLPADQTVDVKMNKSPQTENFDWFYKLPGKGRTMFKSETSSKLERTFQNKKCTCLVEINDEANKLNGRFRVTFKDRKMKNIMDSQTPECEVIRVIRGKG